MQATDAGHQCCRASLGHRPPTRRQPARQSGTPSCFPVCGHAASTQRLTLLPCPAGKLAEVLRVSDTFLEAWSKAGFATTFLSNRQNAQDLAAFFLSLDCCLQGMVLATVQLQGRDGRPFKVGGVAVSTRCWSTGNATRRRRLQGTSCCCALLHEQAHREVSAPTTARILLQGSVTLLCPVQVSGQAGGRASVLSAVLCLLLQPSPQASPAEPQRAAC